MHHRSEIPHQGVWKSVSLNWFACKTNWDFSTIPHCLWCHGLRQAVVSASCMKYLEKWPCFWSIQSNFMIIKDAIHTTSAKWNQQQKWLLLFSTNYKRVCSATLAGRCGRHVKASVVMTAFHFPLQITACTSTLSVWVCQVEVWGCMWNWIFLSSASGWQRATFLKSLSSKWLINFGVVTMGTCLSVLGHGCGLWALVWTVWQHYRMTTAQHSIDYLLNVKSNIYIKIGVTWDWFAVLSFVKWQSAF